MRSALSRSALAFAAFASIPVARADEAKTVKLDVQVISATEGDAGVDKRLEKLRSQLSDYKYSSFQLVSEKSVALAVDKNATIDLPENYVLQVTPRSVEANGPAKVHLNVRSAKQPNLVDTTVTIPPGKTVLVGGMKQKEGKLVLAVTHQASK